jgi:hypothetical protein
MDSGTPGTHHFGCLLRNYLPNNGYRPNILDKPTSPGRAPANTDGTAAHIITARHVWEEDVQTYLTYTSVQQALKKQIISVFEPIYLDVLNDNMVGFANISAVGSHLQHLRQHHCG